jgi:hypothetical protein
MNTPFPLLALERPTAVVFTFVVVELDVQAVSKLDEPVFVRI